MANRGSIARPGVETYTHTPIIKEKDHEQSEVHLCGFCYLDMLLPTACKPAQPSNFITPTPPSPSGLLLSTLKVKQAWEMTERLKKLNISFINLLGFQSLSLQNYL